MALCYNLARVLNILGFDGFVAFFARRVAARAILRILRAVTPAIGGITPSIRRFSAKFGQNSAIICFRYSIAA